MTTVTMELPDEMISFSMPQNKEDTGLDEGESEALIMYDEQNVALFCCL